MSQEAEGWRKPRVAVDVTQDFEHHHNGIRARIRHPNALGQPSCLMDQDGNTTILTEHADDVRAVAQACMVMQYLFPIWQPPKKQKKEAHDQPNTFWRGRMQKPGPYSGGSGWVTYGRLR